MNSTVVLLGKGEDVLRKSTLRELIAMTTQDGDFDLEATTGDRPAQEWIGAALTVPFMSEKRTVVVRNALRCSELETQKDALISGLKSLPPSSILVLVADEETGDPNKQNNFATALSRLETIVAKAGGKKIQFDLDSAALRRQLKEVAESSGKKISESGVTLLIEMCGNSLSRATDELQKLVLYVGSETQIKDADIRTLVVPSREWKIYTLVRSTMSKKPKDALNQLEVLFESFGKVDDAAFSRVFPTFSRQLRVIWQARLILDSGARLPNLPPSVEAQLPLKGSIKSEPDWSSSFAFQIARTTSLISLAGCFQVLADTDSRIKGVLDSTSTKEVLERMILEMISVLQGNELISKQ